MPESYPVQLQLSMEESNTRAPAEGSTRPASTEAPDAVSQSSMEEPNTMAPAEGSVRTEVPNRVPQPPTPTAFRPSLSTQDTTSSVRSVPISELPPGFYEVPIHGTCPYCKHWHRTATARISLNPSVYSGVRCEKCGRKWFGIGGNDSHASLVSQNSLAEADRPRLSALHTAILQNLRSLSAVGSPTLAVLEEDTSPSPLGSGPEFPIVSHSRTTSRRSEVHPESSVTNVTKEVDKPTSQETVQPEPRNEPLEPTGTAPRRTSIPQVPTKPSLTKRIAKKITKKYKDARSLLLRTAKFKRSQPKMPNKGKETVVASQDGQTSQGEEKLQSDLDDGVVERPSPKIQEMEHQHGQPKDSLPEKAKPEREQQPSPWQAERAEFSDRAGSTSPPASVSERLKHREQLIKFLRDELTKERACTCGPICGSECRCRFYGRLGDSNRARDDSSILYTRSNSAFELQDPPLYPSDSQGSHRSSNPSELAFMGLHMPMGPMNSTHPPSLNLSVDGSNRYSITTTTLSGRTCVESDPGMTVTAGPDNSLRAQSLPRTPSRSRYASVSPPMSPLRVQTFLRNDDDSVTSSDNRDDHRRSQDDIGDYRTPTQRDYQRDHLPNGLYASDNEFQDIGRGRSRSQAREFDNELAEAQIAGQDYAPTVNGDGMRRLSEPTSSH